MADFRTLISSAKALYQKWEDRQIERMKYRDEIEAEEHKLRVEQLEYESELYKQEALLGKLQIKAKGFDISR